MTNHENEIELLDYLRVIWKRKWLIIIPTLILVFGVGVYIFSLPKKWEIEALIMPSKFIIRSEQGQFEEIMVAKPKQLVEQINAGSYNHLIIAELGIKIKELPKIRAENIKDTKLIRITAKENDVEKSKIILDSLFNHLKKDMDTKIDVEIKELDTQISTKENSILYKKLLIKDNLTEIKLKQIEKTKTEQESKVTIQKVQLYKSIREISNVLSQDYTVDIIFLLSKEPMRYKQIKKELRLSDNTLSRRLDKLEGCGAIRRLQVSFGTRKGHEYTITELGQELIKFFKNYERQRIGGEI